MVQVRNTGQVCIAGLPLAKLPDTLVFSRVLSVQLKWRIPATFSLLMNRVNKVKTVTLTVSENEDNLTLASLLSV